MARGDPGEGGYTPEVTPLDLPRKLTPRANEVDAAPAFGNAVTAISNKYTADSAAWAGDQLAQARKTAVANLETAKQNLPAGQDPGNFAGDYLASFDKQTGPMLDSAQGSPVASKMLQKGLGDLRDTLQDHTMKYEAQQRVMYRKDSADTNLDSQLSLIEAHPALAQSVGDTTADQYRTTGMESKDLLASLKGMHEKISVAAANGYSRLDPQGTMKALNDADDAPATIKGTLSGLNDAQREVLRNKANDQLGKPVYDSLTDNDTNSAQRHLDDVRPLMDAQHVFALQKTIDGQVEKAKNDQKQDIEDRIQDSYKAAQFGLPNAVQVTRAEMDIRYPKDGQRHWDDLQTVRAAGAQAKQYDHMSIEDIVKDVNGNEPKTGGPEAASKIEGYQMRAKAAEQTIKSRQQDPAQFAQDNGSWKPLDFQDAKSALDNLKGRANTQDQVSSQLGVPTPLLSKQEQGTFTKFLDNQPPADRLQTLAQIRATMPDDHSYTSLLHQIAPNSPITALAGATMDRPQGGNIPTWYNSKFADGAQVGQHMLEGEAILQGKGEKGVPSKFPMPHDTDLQPAFQSAIGGANSDLFRGRADTLDATYAAYKATYAALANKAGHTNGVYSPAIAQQAADEVLGHVTQVGLSSLRVPPGMDPSHFEGALNTAATASMKAGGYSDADIKALAGHGFQEDGDQLGTGVYRIIDGNGDQLKSKDHRQSIIVDLNRQYRIPNAVPQSTEDAKSPSDKLLNEVMAVGGN